MRWPWTAKPTVVPVRLEDYLDGYIELRTLVRNVLTLQDRLKDQETQSRDYAGRLDLLEGNPNSTTGGTLTTDIDLLKRRLAALEEPVHA